MSIKSVMLSNHLILCPPLLPSIFPSIRVFSNVSVLYIRWPKYCSFHISPPNEYSGLISFRIDWLDILAVQGTLKSLLQHHSSKALILQCSSFFISFVHFLPLNNILFYGYTTTLFIHSPTKGYLNCFCFWKLWMKLIETFVCRFLGGHKFSTPLINTKEDGCWTICKNVFSFVRNCQTLFQSVCTVFHSYQKWLRNPTASHPHQHLVLLVLWILAILIRMQGISLLL